MVGYEYVLYYLMWNVIILVGAFMFYGIISSLVLGWNFEVYEDGL